MNQWTTALRRLSAPLTALALAVYFFRLTRGSLHVYFSSDDVTNLYRSWTFPLGRLLRANLLFFETSPFYRPMGSAWYRSIFYFAGFHPLPFHVVNLLLLAANVCLTYAVARRLSGSRETAALTALLACYHAAFNGLCFDTAFIYDVLCYFFYFSTFALYLRIRQAGRFLNPWALAACTGLYICALNSKEMAVTLPLFLGAYECLYHSPRAWSASELRRWMLTEGRATLITGAMTLVFVIGRATGEDSLVLNAAYRPVFTWHRLMETSGQFVRLLFFLGDWFTPAAVVLLWAALLAISWASRSKAMQFAWLFLMLSPAPVAFVEPRGASQYYVSLFGWALYAAAAMVGSTAWIGPRLPGAAGVWAARLRPPLLFAGLILLLYPYYKGIGRSNVWSVNRDAEMVRSIVSQLHGMHPAMPEDARLLFRNAPLGDPWDNLIPIVRLSYRDQSIAVDRGASEVAPYDYIFDYEGGRLEEAARPPDPRLHPKVCMTALGPGFYHADFSEVTPAHPARVGEIVMTKATGLGLTSPEVAPDRPFPTDPLVAVSARVRVRVNGRRAEVLNQIGWPQTIDTYRVDFRVPEGTASGMARLVLAVRGVAAQAVQFPVR